MFRIRSRPNSESKPGPTATNRRTVGHVEATALLEMALIRTIGAGALSFAPACGATSTVDSSADSQRFIDLLHESDEAQTRDLIVGTTEAIWADWRKSGIPMDVAQHHLELIPQLIRDCPPDPDMVVASFAVAMTTNQMGTNVISSQACRLSEAILAKAQSANALISSGLNDSITFYFLEALYTQLLASADFLRKSESVFATFVLQHNSTPILDPTLLGDDQDDLDIEQEIATLMDQFDASGDANVLIEASEICSLWLDVARDTSPPADAARIQILLAEILIERGEHEETAEHFEAAVRYLFLAQEILSAGCHLNDELDLRFALADALGGLGKLAEDPDVLDVSIRLYHNGLAIAVENAFDIDQFGIIANLITTIAARERITDSPSADATDEPATGREICADEVRTNLADAKDAEDIEFLPQIEPVQLALALDARPHSIDCRSTNRAASSDSRAPSRSARIKGRSRGQTRSANRDQDAWPALPYDTDTISAYLDRLRAAVAQAPPLDLDRATAETATQQAS